MKKNRAVKNCPHCLGDSDILALYWLTDNTGVNPTGYSYDWPAQTLTILAPLPASTPGQDAQLGSNVHTPVKKSAVLERLAAQMGSVPSPDREEDASVTGSPTPLPGGAGHAETLPSLPSQSSSDLSLEGPLPGSTTSTRQSIISPESCAESVRGIGLT